MLGFFWACGGGIGSGVRGGNGGCGSAFKALDALDALEAFGRVSLSQTKLKRIRKCKYI